MKLFKKKDEKEKVIPVDENGKPIEPEKKKIDGKKVVKNVLFGLCAAAVGVVTFVAVGVALGATADSSEENSNWLSDIDGSKTGTEENCSEFSDCGTSGEE